MVAISATSAWLCRCSRWPFPGGYAARGWRGEHKAAAAFAVDRLADEAAGHLPQILFFGGDHAAIRATVAECDP